jgi:hypothetical protein
VLNLYSVKTRAVVRDARGSLRQDTIHLRQVVAPSFEAAVDHGKITALAHVEASYDNEDTTAFKILISTTECSLSASGIQLAAEAIISGLVTE